MDRDKLGNRIKKERGKQNISQKQLAEKIGVDPTVYSRMERGERELSIENLIEVSNALNVELGYFLFDSVDSITDAVFEKLLKQARKLNDRQYDTFLKIITALLENADQWELHKLPHLNNATTVNKSVDYEQIGKRIRAERIKQNLTQEKLSELAGLSENFLGNIERAAAICSLESLFRIANALNLPVTRLLINANKMNKATGLCDAVEELSRSSNDKDALLLKLMTVLLDNSNIW